MNFFNHLFLQLFLLCVLNYSFLIADSPYFVSLGGACIIAVELKRLGLREAAFPFDKCVSELSGVIQAIRDDFKFFYHPRHFIRKIHKGTYKAYNKYYNMLFPHDLGDGNNSQAIIEEKDFEDFKKSYIRRCNRFNNLYSLNRKVIFLHYKSVWNKIPYTIKDLIELRDLIKKKYPLLKFKIISIFSSEKESVLNFKELRVIYTRCSLQWGETAEFFEELFVSLGANIKKDKS